MPEKKDTKQPDETKKTDFSDLHTIAYPEAYKPFLAKEGASAFGGITNHPDSRYYKFNDFYHMESDESLHILSHFETYQQTTEYTCGAACALMVLNWFQAKRYHEKMVGQLVESVPGRGTSVENLADFFDLIGWNVEYHAKTDLKFKTVKEFEQSVISYIDRGIPIMVDWVDWSGHWQVIIGVDTCGTDIPYDDVLIFADPYDVTDHFQDGYYTFPLSRFFGMWMEGACAGKDDPYRQPFVIAYPKEKRAEQSFEAKTENLPKVQAFVDEQLEKWECPMKAQIQLDVAVEELFVNIASYSYGAEKEDERPGNAVIQMRLLPDRTAELVFRDSGTPFDPLKNPDPDVTKTAEEREIGGLGIFLVKKSMDEMTYRYENGQNIVTIRKKI